MTTSGNVCFKTLLASLSLLSVAGAADWPGFRGPGGTGISPDDKAIPITWSETENLKWKAELPGPGLSSPIIVGDRVFVTSWSGYGMNAGNPGDQKSLKRHLVCIDRKTGEVIWSQAVDPVLPEDTFRGMFMENGYASHTPVSDGQRVYVFFGKTGALAFDMEGNKLWQSSVGTESDPRDWGSASSPVLYKDLLIVTASAESQAVVALNKETGEEVWRQEATGFTGTWGTPALVKVSDDRTDLVLAVPYEIWGFNPETGKLVWYCEAIQSDSICSSVLIQDGVIYAVESGPRGGGAIAVRGGGEGDVTKSHVLWSNRDRGRIGTPLFHDGRIYWISSRTANCIDAKTGERVYQSRLEVDNSDAGGGRQAGGSGRGGQDYSSPVIADGKMVYVTRAGDAFVVALGPTFDQLAQNRFAGDGSDFSATPAICNGELFIRSNKFLYCVAAAID